MARYFPPKTNDKVAGKLPLEFFLGAKSIAFGILHTNQHIISAQKAVCSLGIALRDEGKVWSVMFSWWEKLHWPFFLARISLGLDEEITGNTFCNVSNQPKSLVLIQHRPNGTNCPTKHSSSPNMLPLKSTFKTKLRWFLSTSFSAFENGKNLFADVGKLLADRLYGFVVVVVAGVC